MINTIKTILKKEKIDFFLLPNNDEFFSEYLPKDQKKIELISGFTGSNATIIITNNKSYFFTDGRYILQAKQQLDNSEFVILDLNKISVLEWLKINVKAKSLAIDPKLTSIKFVLECQKFVKNIVFISEEINNLLYQKPNKKSAIFYCNQKQNIASDIKREQISKNLEVDALFITKPENLCWLVNIRSCDIEYTPIFLAYAILHQNNKITIFADRKRFKDCELENFEIIPFEKMQDYLKNFFSNTPTIQIDDRTTNYWLYKILQNTKTKIIFKNCPIELAKSIKNPFEIKSAYQAHEIDGLAVTKFLYWLKNSYNNSKQIDEISAQEKLFQLRKQSPKFISNSFATISAYAENSAIIHYNSSKQTNKKIVGNSLYLIDSGGQYFGSDMMATTDVTRTLAIGSPTLEMIENYTRVLKGHIAIARLKFPRNICGANIDSIARFHLWNDGKDYAHGTGHGVGSFLSVHEGPCAISKRSYQQLLPNMILSNEPGFYKDQEYGIRLENLVVIKEYNDDFLNFETLTLVPFEPELIDYKMLTYPEKKWLKEYHQGIYLKLKDKLLESEKNWLNNICQRFF